MSHPHDLLPSELIFYASEPHRCSYLEETAVTVFADPRSVMTTSTYSALSDLGFRRSGEYVYAPRCPACNACLPTRIPVTAFTPDRSQRRNWKSNHDLRINVLPLDIYPEHFELYQRYINSRHPDGSMANPDINEYRRFFGSQWAETHLVEFRLGDSLLAVSVMDILNSGVSAVYTFFDPVASKRGLGTYAVLWLIEECKRRELPYLYLGYLIHESPRMAYKKRYQPLETFHNGVWHLHHPS